MRKLFKLFDYHTHVLDHGLSKSLRIEETIKSAVDKGLNLICLTDHYPLPSGFKDPTKEKDCAMPMSWYPEYQKKAGEITKKYSSQIEVLRGAEVDWLPGYEKWTKEEIARWSFDYLIGSVHFLGQIKEAKGKRSFVIDYQEEEFRSGVAYYGGVRPLIEAYYKEVRSMVNSGLFDGVGHIDLIKKYNDGSLFSEDEKWYRKEVLQTLDVIAKEKMIMEVNTSGWDRKCNAFYPSFWVLKEARKRNISVTLGSDGHTPETIGKDLEKGRALIKASGYGSIVRFRKREKIEIKI